MNTEVPQGTRFVYADGITRATASSPRSRTGLLDLYQASALVFVLCLVYLDIPNYIYSQNEGFPAKYFYYVFFVAMAPLLILRFKALIPYLSTPFSLWLFALILLDTAHLMVALADGDTSRATLVGTRIQYAVLAALIGFACSVTRSTSYERIFPLLAVVIPAVVIADFLYPGVFYLPGSEDTVFGRAAATFLNPNKAGEAILLTFLLAIPVLRPHYRALLLLLVGAGAVLTFSRGAMLGWMLLWIFLLVRKGVPKYTLAVALVALGALPVLIGSFESYLSGRGDLAGGLDDVLARLEFFQVRAFDDYSSLERAQVLETGLELFLQNPVFGAGGGTTLLWPITVSTHNQLVMLAAEYGIFGIALWAWLGLILWKGKYFQDKKLQLVAVAGFIFLSMFTHNMFDFPYWLLTFALVSGQRRG